MPKISLFSPHISITSFFIITSIIHAIYHLKLCQDIYMHKHLTLIYQLDVSKLRDASTRNVGLNNILLYATLCWKILENQ